MPVTWTKGKVNETRYEGTIDGAQLREAMTRTVADLVGLRDGEPGRSLAFYFIDDPAMPGLRFSLVKDHDWFRKQTHDEDPATTD